MNKPHSRPSLRSDGMGTDVTLLTRASELLLDAWMVYGIEM